MRRFINRVLCWLLGHQRKWNEGALRWRRHFCTRCGRFLPND